ncbi:MAG: hypothetical protein IKO54_09395 [Lachnospiraceae bacterium]|nr:hypothetical protein [Lachnospiraceae bacterium]
MDSDKKSNNMGDACTGDNADNHDIKPSVSKAKEILFTLLTYAVLYVISFLLLILLIRLPLLKGMHVLMYRGIVMIVLAGILAAALLIVFKEWRKITWLSAKDVVLVFILTCSINMVFFTLIPVTVERSVSVFMLSYMDTYSDRTYTEDQVAEIFVDKYVNEYGAFEKRFDEQLTTGTIVQNADGTYSITDKGRFIVKLFRLISDVFDTDERLVNPAQR